MSSGNIILYALLLLLLMGCSSNQPTGPVKSDINKAILQNRLPRGEKIALVSCIRCGCFVKMLNNLTSQEKTALQDVVFLSDTTCNKINYPSLHITQSAIDSISQDLYNIVLFRKTNEGYDVRLIETEESKDFTRICTDFFR
jgi:hypothetical protein